MGTPTALWFCDAFRTPQKQHALNRQLHGISTILGQIQGAVGKQGFRESYYEGLLPMLRPKGWAEGVRTVEVGLGEQEALREHLLVLKTIEQDSGIEGKRKNVPEKEA